MIMDADDLDLRRYLRAGSSLLSILEGGDERI